MSVTCSIEFPDSLSVTALSPAHTTAQPMTSRLEAGGWCWLVGTRVVACTREEVNMGPSEALKFTTNPTQANLTLCLCADRTLAQCRASSKEGSSVVRAELRVGPSLQNDDRC